MPSPDLGPAPRHPRTWPTWLLIAFAWCLARMPWGVQRRAGAARATLLREHFTSLGIGVFEFLRAWWGRLAPLDATATIAGVERLRAAQAGGRGVILVSPHFMTLEICVRI